MPIASDLQHKMLQGVSGAIYFVCKLADISEMFRRSELSGETRKMVSRSLLHNLLEINVLYTMYMCRLYSDSVE